MSNQFTPRIEVALTKCYFCQNDSDIIINTKPTPYMANQVESMHQKTVSMDPCRECAEFMKQGVILIAIDEDKSGPDWNNWGMPNPYRTGGWWVVRDDFVHRVFDEAAAKYVCKHRFAFVSQDAAEMVGLSPSTSGNVNHK